MLHVDIIFCNMHGNIPLNAASFSPHLQISLDNAPLRLCCFFFFSLSFIKSGSNFDMSTTQRDNGASTNSTEAKKTDPRSNEKKCCKWTPHWFPTIRFEQVLRGWVVTPQVHLLCEPGHCPLHSRSNLQMFFLITSFVPKVLRLRFQFTQKCMEVCLCWQRYPKVQLCPEI